MFFLKLLVLLLVYVPVGFVSTQDLSITYNGFHSANLSFDGIAKLTNGGLLMLTTATTQEKGHAFYKEPVIFKQTANGPAFSFSTTFVFAIVSEYPDLSGHGLAFVIAPTRGLPAAIANHYLGLFNQNNTGKATNHVVAVELDAILSNEFEDINDNHVGIDINGLKSIRSEPAKYYDDSTTHNLILKSGKPMQVWVDYDGATKQMNVTLAPISAANKPNHPLISLTYDLSPILKQTMYIGFSSSTGSVPTYHCVLGWSFKINGAAQALHPSGFPKLPRVGPKQTSKLLTIGLPIIVMATISVMIAGVAYRVRIRKKFAEVLEDWELEYGPQRFKYKDLYIATKGFKNKGLLGKGGFGKVYHGVLPRSKIEVAVKKMAHESGQGMKEFVAEIVSIGHLRHRNLVPLLGYCRRKEELLLVYEYMPNGSLEKFLHDHPQNNNLNWKQRFRIIKGVASGLLHLHEGCEQLVIHRDVKASNVLLDGEFNGRLGDFGLARLYDHGTEPRTTHIVGTLGYLAPEQTRTGKATTSTDVYAFGAFLLEVVCGRRPIEPPLLSSQGEDSAILLDWVVLWWNKGEILKAVDPRMGFDYAKEEVESVMKLALLCSHSEPTLRPSMRQVVLYLDGALALPDLSSLHVSAATGLSFAASHREEGFSDYIVSYASSSGKTFSQGFSGTTSLLSGGR